jgi:hypothetical protein
MEITVGTRRNTTASVRHTHSGQSISAIVLTSLALLIGGAIALCVALQQRLLAPPSLHAPHGDRRGCVSDGHR